MTPQNNLPQDHLQITQCTPLPLTYRLRTKAQIRRQIKTRKSAQEGKPDIIADLLEEAAKEIQTLQTQLATTDMVLERERKASLVLYVLGVLGISIVGLLGVIFIIFP